MAHYTVAEAITAVRDRFNEPAPGIKVTNTEITAWLNWAARNISSVTHCYHATATSSGILTLTETVTTVASTFQYSLTAQFIRIHDVTFEPAATTPYGLKRIRPQHFGHGFVKGETGSAVVPKFYFYFGNSLFIWPSPIGAANVGAYIKVYGSVSCEDYVHTETADIYGIPDRLQPLAVDYALACCCIKTGQMRRASELMQNYFAMLDFERKDNYDRKRTPDTRDTVEIPTRNVIVQQ